MLNKRILSLLLAIVLVVGLMPTSVFATETGGTTAPTESVPETTGEAIVPQNEEDPTPCGICNVVDCGVEHKYCEKCEKYDCGKAHVICEVCKVEDCGVEHEQCDLCGEYDCDGNDVFCDTCNAWNCGKLHNITCETCGKVDCAGHDVTIPTLPTEPEGEEETEEGEVDEHQKLYEDILACDELFEADALVDALSEEEYAAFLEYLTDEQEKELNDHFDDLIKAYEAKTDVVEDPAAEETEEEEDNREIVYPTKDMTKAAPFGDPVEGPVKRMLRMFAAAPAAEEEDNGLILDKDVSGPDANGVYTLTLEAYATGAKTIIKQESNIPTDIILVLDQSGSMAYDFGGVDYRETSGTPSELYSDRNNLYVKLSDNSYSPVSVRREYATTASVYNTYTNQTNSTYYENRNNLYHKCSDDSYSQITVSRSGNRGNRQYTYTCASCGSLGATSSGSNTRPSYSGDFYLATTEYQYQYTFSYTKADGTTETATVMQNEAAPDWDFYESYESGTIPRLDALKNAVSTFVSSVAEKEKGADGTLGTDDDVDHRIAIVGFSSDDYNNTEILTGCTINRGNNYYGTNASTSGTARYFPTGYAMNGVQYGGNGYNDACENALVSANSQSATDAINALTAYGGTYTDDGVAMADDILDANPVASGEKRNRVVIVFTDGIPGLSGYDSSVANRAISSAAGIKSDGATVYTVGIFDGADATSAGNSYGNDTQKANYFMQRLSSNTSYPQTPSYYLSASDSSALTSIFKTISENIENGGSSIELDETTVVKDIISDSFTLPAGADASSIKVYTDGVNEADGEFNDDPQAFTDAQITINGRDISVTNFDFAENWVGSETDADGETTYRGQKLILEIPIVPNSDFLGGNNIPTNSATSGIYRGDEMVEAFPEPDTDVAVKVLDIGVTTADQKIYLSQEADIAALVTSLDGRINGSNNAYVDIQYTIMDGTTPIAVVDIPAGNSKPETITWVVGEGVDMNPALTDDSKTYTIIATASPTSQGTATQSKNEKPATVTVYKPFVTFQDTSVNAGDSANFDGPSEENRNLVTIEWKNTAGLVADAAVMGPAPELAFGYDKEEGPLSVETEVKVTSVKANNMEIISGVTFYRDTCTAANGCDHVNDGKPVEEGAVNFIVHIKTFDLTITKKGVDVNKDGLAPFVFNVKGGDIDMDVVIYGNNSVTIKGLPAGTYTVTEVNGYWRYDIAFDDTASKTVTPSGTTASVEFKNARTEDKWLDDWAKATNNFG